MGRPIRLAYFIGSLEIGGSELNAIRTLEVLSRERFEVTVFHLSHQGPLLSGYEALGLPMVPVSLSAFWHPSSVLAARQVYRELRRRRIEIVHSHDIYSNIFAVPVARLAGIPAVVASRRWLHAVPSGLHARANGFVSRLATHVLANSQAVADAAAREDGVDAERVKVITNFVNDDAFAPASPSDRKNWLSKHGLDMEGPIIGIVARLAEVKDHRTLLAAFVRVLRQVPTARLVIIGDGPSRSDIEQEIQRLGISPRVFLLGTLIDRTNLHQYFDVSVLCSRTEGFPNTLIEAMAAGRPVVATKVGGVTDAVIEGRTGLLVPPESPNELAEALVKLLVDRQQAEAMGVAGRQRALQHFHRRAVIAQLEDWYSEVEAASGNPWPRGPLSRASRHLPPS